MIEINEQTMMAGTLLGYVLGALFGVICIAAAIFNWDFLMSGRRWARHPAMGKRAVNFLVGVVILVSIAGYATGIF
jgi:hypothetical protein